MMNKLNAKGFSAVEGLLLSIAAVLVGFVGWYVWHSKQNTNNSYKAASNTQSTASTNSVGPKKIKWIDAPKDLQKAVIASYQKYYPNCLSSNKGPDKFTTSLSIMEDKYAELGEGCEPGSAVFLYVKVTGAWKNVSYTQDIESCELINKYNIPKAFFEYSTIQKGDAYCIYKNGKTETL